MPGDDQRQDAAQNSAQNAAQNAPHPLRVVTIAPAHFAGLAQLQRDCYPTLAAHELMREEHFASQHEVFADGQIVVLDGARVVGQGSGFFIDFDFAHPNHRFSEIADGFYFRTHNPAGAWYYGADISVHPDYRGWGLGKLLYGVRKQMVQRYNRRGIVAGGLIPGFARMRGQMTPQEYVRRVVAGELKDPTLNFQMSQGFQVWGLIENYIDDSASDNWATLIVWENPEYTAPQAAA